MILDKGLILKGVAGVAAVGGIATTGVALKEGTALNKLLFSSPKAEDGVQSDQPEAENLTEDKHDASKTSQNHSTPQGQDTGRSGDTDSQLRTDNAPGGIVTGGHRSSAPTEDDYGIPTKCKTTSPCELTEDELKKIKFEALGDEDTPEVTVEGFPTDGNQKITLKIDSTESNKKKYIFSNGSSREVKVKRGEDKTVSLGTGRTKFLLENKKLKKMEVDNYGLPSDCKSSCTLTYTDLEDIKFDGLEGTLTVTPTNKTVSLTIDSSSSEHKRYLFTSSSSSVTIKGSTNPSSPITLSSSKTRFKDNSGKLKKIELDNKGIPSDCKSTCTLTADDLKHVKFPGFEDQSGDVTVSPSDKTISLTIENSNKYNFNESSGSNITIKKGDVTITLTGSTSTVFTEENGKLVKETSLEILNKKIKEAGFPVVDNCDGREGDKCCQLKEGEDEKDCKLTKDQFKDLKFKKFGGGGVDESTIGAIDNSSNFKVKIKKIKAEEKGNYPTGTDLKFIFDGFTADLSVQKKGDGSNTIYLKKNSDTEFILDSSNQLERAWNRKTLGNKIGLTCPSESECTVEGPINLITSSGGSNQKHEGMSKSSSSGEAKFKVTTGSGYREGYIFKVENSDITLTSSSGDSQTLTKECCYEAKWDEKKWWLAHKANSC